MNKEEKQLLLKDLCARLPYGVIVSIKEVDSDRKPWVGELSCKDLDCFIHDVVYESIKPYLRPVSSMTEEEMDILFDILHIDKNGNDEDWIKINDDSGIKFLLPSGRWMEEMDKALSYLRSIHIDIHDFIGQKLASPAPEGMYESKNN